MKRIILMYISEVSGHHSATLAIEKALRILSPEAEILNINAFNYTNPISEKVINRLYMGVIKRTPQIWDYLYDNPAVARNLEKIKETIHKFNSPKLRRLFDKFRPDVVVCTQAFPCGMCADYKKTFNPAFKLVAALTDYVPHSYWIYDTVDYYIAPSQEVELRLIKKGVAPDKIKTLGIPFDPKFNAPLDKNGALSRLGLRPGIPVILIMGGGQGLGPIKTVIKTLENVAPDLQEIIVTGTNKKLYRSLKRKIKKYRKKIALLGYAANINELMSAADIIISKPGGVTTAEVLSKKVPMIIISPIPGQEVNNTRYLTEKGAAIEVDDAEEIGAVIEELFREPDILNRMRECSSRIAKPNASMDIAGLLLNI